MDIDKLILNSDALQKVVCFGSLMDIDKLIQLSQRWLEKFGFGSLMDIDKLIHNVDISQISIVLVL